MSRVFSMLSPGINEIRFWNLACTCWGGSGSKPVLAKGDLEPDLYQLKGFWNQAYTNWSRSRPRPVPAEMVLEPDLPQLKMFWNRPAPAKRFLQVLYQLKRFCNQACISWMYSGTRPVPAEGVLEPGLAAAEGVLKPGLHQLKGFWNQTFTS